MSKKDFYNRLINSINQPRVRSRYIRLKKFIPLQNFNIKHFQGLVVNCSLIQIENCSKCLLELLGLPQHNHGSNQINQYYNKILEVASKTHFSIYSQHYLLNDDYNAHQHKSALFTCFGREYQARCTSYEKCTMYAFDYYTTLHKRVSMWNLFSRRFLWMGLEMYSRS